MQQHVKLHGITGKVEEPGWELCGPTQLRTCTAVAAPLTYKHCLYEEWNLYFRLVLAVSKRWKTVMD